MAFVEKLKQADLFIDGRWAAENTSVTLPKIGRKREEYRGGLNRPVKFDMGGEALEAEWTCGGWVRDIITGMGATTLDGVQMRFVASLQDDSTGAINSWEAVIGGRHSEIDLGESKPGEDTEMKGKTDVVFFQLTRNGEELVYIDVLNMIERIAGVDIMAGHRAALGRF